MSDPVNHPSHYTSHPSKVECIQITEHMGFCLGNVIKYVWRADEKGKAVNAIEDLKKAKWYLEREIAKRESDEKAYQDLWEDFVRQAKSDPSKIRLRNKTIDQCIRAGWYWRATYGSRSDKLRHGPYETGTEAREAARKQHCYESKVYYLDKNGNTK